MNTTQKQNSFAARLAFALITLVTLAALPAKAQASDEELTKQSLNPVAALISVPLKNDYDKDIGPTKQGSRYQLTVQPVIPFSISQDWNLISRTLMPLISQKDVAPSAGYQSGVGDINQQFYFSPKAPSASGWIWGVGPQILLRTGSDMGSDKWGIGPTAVLLKQERGWTYGALVNHMWSITGNDQTSDISLTYLQPFLSFTTKGFTTYGINTESTYDFKSSQWSVPINATVTQLLKIGGQSLNLLGGVRYWADTPDDIGPKGFGFRIQVTFLFPK